MRLSYLMRLLGMVRSTLVNREVYNVHYYAGLHYHCGAMRRVSGWITRISDRMTCNRLTLNEDNTQLNWHGNTSAVFINHDVTADLAERKCRQVAGDGHGDFRTRWLRLMRCQTGRLSNAKFSVVMRKICPQFATWILSNSDSQCRIGKELNKNTIFLQVASATHAL